MEEFSSACHIENWARRNSLMPSIGKLYIPWHIIMILILLKKRKSHRRRVSGTSVQLLSPVQLLCYSISDLYCDLEMEHYINNSTNYKPAWEGKKQLVRQKTRLFQVTLFRRVTVKGFFKIHCIAKGKNMVNQPWILIGRTIAEAPILWPPGAKSWIIGKDA